MEGRVDHGARSAGRARDDREHAVVDRAFSSPEPVGADHRDAAAALRTSTSGARASAAAGAGSVRGARGFGPSQRQALDHLKIRGTSTVPAMADDLDLNVETVRAHIRVLEASGLVDRVGRKRGGPGRPEVVYGLSRAAEALYPSVEGDLLADLASYLERTGRDDVVEVFLEERIASRRMESMERVRGLEGDDRLDEVARILSEQGFMAVIEADEAGRRVLRLCHCPMRNLVAVTKAPCRVELGFVRELLGERLARVSYIPAGDASCSYTPASEAQP